MHTKFVITLILLTISNVGHAKSYHGYDLPLEFTQAMISNPKHTHLHQTFIESMINDELFNLIEQNYRQFVMNIESITTEHVTIPTIIHQIWIGPREVPAETLKWQATWQALHPEWEYKLWTNTDLASITLINQEAFDNASNWGEKADIFRLELLYQYGGLYVDIDFACIKPFDLLHHSCDFYTGMHTLKLLRNRVRIANGLIGAIPHHPVIAHAIEQIPLYVNRDSVTERTGPDFFTTIISESLKESELSGNRDIVFPANYFYPQGVTDGTCYRIIDNTMLIQPETIAAHYYTSYWVGSVEAHILERERKQRRKAQMLEKQHLKMAGQYTKKRKIKKNSLPSADAERN